MARGTVEDCVTKIPNRFDLVLIASQRARAVASGAPLTVERDNDKNPVIALREIAEGTVSVEELAEAAIQGLRKHVEVDEPIDDEMDLIMGHRLGEAAPEEPSTGDFKAELKSQTPVESVEVDDGSIGLDGAAEGVSEDVAGSQDAGPAEADPEPEPAGADDAGTEEAVAEDADETK